MKVIRSILRENFRRHIKCELPLEKKCKDRLVPLKNRVPATAKLGKKHHLKWKLKFPDSGAGRVFKIVTMTIECHVSDPQILFLFFLDWRESFSTNQCVIRAREDKQTCYPPSPHCNVSLAVLREDLIRPKLILLGRRHPLAYNIGVLSSGFPLVTQT